MWNVPTGYVTDHILTMTVTAVQGNRLDFHQRALERVSRLSGVRNAAFAWGVPLTGTSWPGEIEIEGHPVVTPDDRIAVPLRAVTPGYFALLSLPVVEGRDFRPTDAGKAPFVAIVNQTLAGRYFPNGSAIGKRLWGNGRDKASNEIVGVVADSRPEDLTQATQPEIYLPLWQALAFSKDLIVRTEGDPRAMFQAIERALRETDPTVAIENVRTLDQVRVESVSSRTFASRLLGSFSGAAVVLTLVGLYGILSLSVAARRREIAIRSAVGAQPQGHPLADSRRGSASRRLGARRRRRGGAGAGARLAGFSVRREAGRSADARQRIATLRPRQPARLLGAGAPSDGCGPARGVAGGLTDAVVVLEMRSSVTRRWSSIPRA